MPIEYIRQIVTEVSLISCHMNLYIRVYTFLKPVFIVYSTTICLYTTFCLYTVAFTVSTLLIPKRLTLSVSTAEKKQNQLDTTGLQCPEPVMLLHKKIRELVAGEYVEVIASDPSTWRDIPKFCQFLSHDLIKKEEKDKMFYYLIRKRTCA